MKLRHTLTALLLSLAFTGCATFNDQEMGQIRQKGVSPVVLGKMQQGGILTPQDVIQLAHRGVPDEFIIRQIQDAGVDYVLNKSDLKKLAASKVSKDVAVALMMASDDFAQEHTPQGPSNGPQFYFSTNVPAYGYGYGYPYDSYAYPGFGYDPYSPFDGPYYGGAIYYGGRFHGHHWHRR